MNDLAQTINGETFVDSAELDRLRKIAACFEDGDTRCLKNVRGLAQAAAGKESWSEELGCIDRLIAAAKLAEDSCK